MSFQGDEAQVLTVHPFSTPANVLCDACRSVKVLLILAVVLSAALHLVLLPVEWISSLVLDPETVDASVRAFRYAAASTVPILLVSVCRYFSVKMFENAFFAGLSTRDAELTETIRKVWRKVLAGERPARCYG